MNPRVALAALVALAGLSAGCGGGDGFSGKAEVPSGYAIYKGDGVSVAYPRGWQVEEGKDSDGGARVQITPRDRAKTPYGLILLSATPNADKRFDNLLEGRRTVIKVVAKGKIVSDEKIDVPGAREAHRLTSVVPPDQGNDPVEVRSDSLDLLRDDGDELTVVVADPQRKGDDDLDPKAVVGSVRLRD